MSEKKQKKPKKEGAKTRKQKSWKAKQLFRCEKAEKALSTLATSIFAAKAPNVDAEKPQASLGSLAMLKMQLNALPDDWKPAKGHRPGTSKKIGIGSIVMVRTDLKRDEIKLFKHIPAETFANASVLDDDGRYWLVKCSDGVTRVLAKKLAAKVPEKAEAAETATAEAA